MSTLMQASNQWSSRPADERFVSLFEMGAKMRDIRNRSAQKAVSSRGLKFRPTEGNEMRGLEIVGPSGVPAIPTNWSFGQAARAFGAPAGYLDQLPAPLAADCLNYGIQVANDAKDLGILLTREEDHTEIRAVTSDRYGRIWNADIVDALVNRFGDGRTGDFKIPGEFGKQVEITKANTTLYGSDRDMFVFLADEENRIEMPNRRNGESGSLARGFFVWNSEVGAQTVGVAFFLFDYVCANRIVWGAQEYQEIRLRHTVSAPDRWIDEVAPVLEEYAHASALPISETIKAAQAKKVDQNLTEFMRNRFGLGKKESVAIQAAHEKAEGRPIESLWDLTTGITEYAKVIPFQDQRVAMERIGGKVLDLVAVAA